MELELIHNIKLNDGRTIKEHNMELKHNIPLGALVEVKYSEWFGNGASMKVHARLFVSRHNRDCDGTPLYSVGPRRWNGDWESHGHSEGSLTVIEQTPEVLRGDNALEWPEDREDGER